MVIALVWTLISALGLAVAIGVLVDTLWYYARFRKERPELARGYRIEVVQDLAIATVQGCFAGLGTLALLRLGQDDPGIRSALALIGLVLLLAGPVLLTLASLNHYWSRRRL